MKNEDTRMFAIFLGVSLISGFIFTLCYEGVEPNFLNSFSVYYISATLTMAVLMLFSCGFWDSFKYLFGMTLWYLLVCGIFLLTKFLFPLQVFCTGAILILE